MPENASYQRLDRGSLPDEKKAAGNKKNLPDSS
jgi:hypothetical protein